jgi:hypothetical protein
MLLHRRLRSTFGEAAAIGTIQQRLPAMDARAVEKKDWERLF